MYKWTELDYELKKIIGDSYVPLEERTPEEQEAAYDAMFDWEDEDTSK